MKSSIVSLIFYLLLCGCDSQHVQYVNAADPALLPKLGLSDEDWLHIKQLASERKEFVILNAGRVDADTIEIWFKKPADTRNDQGGPMARFEKHKGHWMTETNFNGDWYAAQGSTK